MKTPFSKEFDYYGKRMRPFYNLWGFAISDDGKTVLRYYEKDFDGSILAKRPPKRLTIQYDGEGRAYVSTRDHGEIMVDLLVAKCFCVRCPRPYKDYELVHKDGNLANCHYLNLTWQKKVTADSQITIHTATDSIRLQNGLTVHKDGTIEDNGVNLPLEISQYDPDTNLFWSIEPKISYYRSNRWGKVEKKSDQLDALMARAGYIEGEFNSFPNPRILHKDGDWLNHESSNLEWCDASDQRYLDYSKKRTEDMNTWNKNNNKDFPDCFLRT